MTAPAAPVRWYHGGVPGLGVGDWLVPPDCSGTCHRLSLHAPEGAPHGTRTDVVYVTSDPEVARVYAAFYPDGAVYEVDPDGPVEPDPDAPELAGMCDMARIVAVARPRVMFAHRRPESWLRILTRERAR